MKLILFVILIFAINSYYSWSQMKLITNNGERFTGFVIIESENDVELQTLEGTVVKIPKTSIDSLNDIKVEIKTKAGIRFKGFIKALRENDFDFISTDSAKAVMTFESIEGYFSEDSDVMTFLKTKFRNIQYPKSVKNQSLSKVYKKIGLAVGTPVGIGVLFASNNGKRCIGISGGLGGVQLNFGVNVFQEASFEFNVLFNISYMQYQYTESTYYMNYNKNKFGIAFGPLLEIYFYGFHAQVGAAMWSDNNFKLPLYLQAGIVHRFGK